MQSKEDPLACHLVFVRFQLVIFTCVIWIGCYSSDQINPYTEHFCLARFITLRIKYHFIKDVHLHFSSFFLPITSQTFTVNAITCPSYCFVQYYYVGWPVLYLSPISSVQSYQYFASETFFTIIHNYLFLFQCKAWI